MTALLRDSLLTTLAEAVDDIETVRIANENRYRSMTLDDPDFGHGIDVDDPAAVTMAAIVDALKGVEERTIRQLQKTMRAHPLGDFVAETPGLGEKQVARLLAKIGDPYWHDAEDRPRSVRELWAYCGLHVIDGQAPRRTKGVKLNWNQDAKMRVWLIAASCIKISTSPYRAVYDATREKYADAVHETACVRCGPSGKPAPIGSTLNAGHQHARAMRQMCKDILLDLWVAAKIEHDWAAKVAAA